MKTSRFPSSLWTFIDGTSPWSMESMTLASGAGSRCRSCSDCAGRRRRGTFAGRASWSHRSARARSARTRRSQSRQSRRSQHPSPFEAPWRNQLVRITNQIYLLSRNLYEKNVLCSVVFRGVMIPLFLDLNPNPGMLKILPWIRIQHRNHKTSTERGGLSFARFWRW